MLDAAAAQPLLTGYLPAASHKPPESLQNSPGCMQSITYTPWDGSGPSLEDFPPLERGRTSKIRATFEASSKHFCAELGQPRPRSNPNANREKLVNETTNKDSPCTEVVVVSRDTPTSNDTPMDDAEKIHTENEKAEKIYTEKGEAEKPRMEKPRRAHNGNVGTEKIYTEKGEAEKPRMEKPRRAHNGNVDAEMIHTEQGEAEKPRMEKPKRVHNGNVGAEKIHTEKGEAELNNPKRNGSTPKSMADAATQGLNEVIQHEVVDATPGPSSWPKSMADLLKGTSLGSASNTLHGGGVGASSHPDRPKTMADMLKGSSDPNGPQAFEPDKIQNIGFASVSDGIPAIYFSGAETQKLAESMGHAIVGKFSHSIPTGLQIQKTLDNIKLRCGFSWKYINAKHILIQCEDLADYARILGSPKGTPVWLIDRHPMRVFKWTPDFDAYCESPIAAIWCNLIGLPIHLFDQSALFAIGKLLGTPIQIDRATANKTRLSFARICVEIDITKPPPEEIILDLGGRETVQRVRWDKIPSYCQECKHVGHASEVCYATGKKERPPKRNYHNGPPKQPQPERQAEKGKQDTGKNGPNEWKRHGKKQGKANVHSGAEWSGPDFLGVLQSVGNKDMIIAHDEQNFIQPKGTLAKSSSFGRGRGGKPIGADMARCEVTPASDDLVQPTGRFKPFDPEKHETQGTSSHMSTNRYFSLMARENFIENDLEDEEQWEDSKSHNEHDDGANPAPLEAGPSYGGNDLQIIEFQGGTSIPPGTRPSC